MDFFQAAKSACIQRAGLIPDDVCIIIGVLKLLQTSNNFDPVQTPLSFYFVDRFTMPSATRLSTAMWTVFKPMPTSKMLFEQKNIICISNVVPNAETH